MIVVADLSVINRMLFQKQPSTFDQVATNSASTRFTSSEPIDTMASAGAEFLPRHSNASNSSEESNGFVKVDHRHVADFHEE